MFNRVIKSFNLNWVALFLLLTLLIPYFYLSFFIHPAADDYNYAFLTISNNWVSEYINQFYTWNGRYASNVLVLLNPIAFNKLFVYQLIPIVLVLFTFLSVYFIFTSIYKAKLTNIIKINLSLSLTLFYLFVMPNIAEGIYWFTGAITYHLSVVLGVLYVSLLYRYLNGNYLFGKIFHLIMIALLIVIIIGFNEIAMVVMLFFHLLFLTSSFYKYKSKRAISVILFIIVLFFSFIMFYAPGNEVRAGFFENKHQLGLSILMSFLQTIRFIFDWVSNLPFIILSVLFIYVIKDINDNIGILKVSSFKKLILLSLIIPMVVFICIFPAYWSTGILGQHRTVNVACFLFIILWLIILILWVNFFKDHSFIKNIEKSINKRFLIVLFLITLIALAITKNGYNAYTDILYGKALGFDKEMNDRYAAIYDFKRKSILTFVSNPLQNKPSTIYVLDITSDSTHWINCGYASFYGLKSVYLKPK